MLATIGLRILRVILWFPIFVLVLPRIIWDLCDLVLRPLFDKYSEIISSPFYFIDLKIQKNIDAAHMLIPPEKIRKTILKGVI